MTIFEKALHIKNVLDEAAGWSELGLLTAIHDALVGIDKIEEAECELYNRATDALDLLRDDAYDDEEEIELTADEVYNHAVADSLRESQRDKGERVHVPYSGAVLDKAFGPGGCK